MMKIVLLFLLMLTLVNAEPTKTTTTFSDEKTITDSDEYGNSVYQREVIIKTTDFKVKNFWSRFFSPDSKELNHALVSKAGVVNIKVEATSACALDSELPAEGCSGQKPFLINKSVLDNPIDVGGDEYEVAFSTADKFDALEDQVFYPLDVLRDEKHYKESAAPAGGSKRSFFSFFTGIFDFMFSKTIGFGKDFFGQKDIADVEETPRSDVAQDRRERYIANIIAGVEKKYRMTKEYKKATATQIEAPRLNTPTSLLHYAEAEKTTEQEQCKFMFLNLSSDGLMCRAMSGLGMNAWMPFFTKSQTTKLEVNTIMGDTENALLAMTSQIEDVPYMQDVGGNDNTKLSFLQNLLKPVTATVGFLKRLLFGSSKEAIAPEPVERVYDFTDDAMTLTMAVTNDGTQIDDFANFKLLKIRSVYGDTMNSCKVKKSGLFGWTKTFVEGGNQSVKSPDSTIFHKEYWNDDEWISWCQEATGKKGIFSTLFETKDGKFNLIGNLFNTIGNLLSNLFGGSYKVEDFTNSITRALVLEIKKVELDPLSEMNRQTIEIVKID